MDKKQLLKALRQQVEKLDDPSFDLEVWKAAALALLARTFGADDLKVKQLETIKIDYSSWALRDAPSTYDPRESTKKMAREILEAAIQEIDIFGHPQQNDLQQALQQAFTQQEIETIQKLLTEKDMGKLQKALEKMGKQKSVIALTHLLTYIGF